MKLTKDEKDLLEEVLRKSIADLQSEQYRAERDSGKKFPFYDEKIKQIKNLYRKLV